MKILCSNVCVAEFVCVCVNVRKAGRGCVSQCNAEKRTKGPFIAVTHWQPLPMHLQCSQHILSGKRCTHTHTHTHIHIDTHAHTHTHSALYLTEPNYIIDTSPCRMKQKTALFSDWWSLKSLCRSLLLLPLSASFVVSVRRLVPPPTHLLIHRLILDSLNKTQIKTDNEESFPLTVTFICCDCYSESGIAVRLCVSVCVFRVEMTASPILSLRLPSLVVKQNSRAHPWPTILCVCVRMCACVCVLCVCAVGV